MSGLSNQFPGDELSSGGVLPADTGQSGETAAALTIRLLGDFYVRVGGQEMPRLRSRSGQYLLALLALRSGVGNRPTERFWLAGTLWPDSTQSQALYNLSRNLTDLRHALGAEGSRLLSPTRDTLLLRTQGAFVDVAAFDAAIRRHDIDASLEEAVSLYRGPLLAGWDEEWVLLERASCEQAYVEALSSLAAKKMEAGQHARAADLLRRLLATDPIRESACCLLMRCLAASGDYAEATQVYRDLRLRLHEELRTAPCADTEAVYQDLRTEARRRARNGGGGTLASGRAVPGGLPQAPGWPESERAKSAAVPASAVPASVPLSTPLTALIGREAEGATLRMLLTSSRLVTLTGTGGVGKTRLALKAAGDAMADYSGAVYFADLTPLTDSQVIPQSIATALGIRESLDRAPLEVLAAQIGQRRCLLVLDNCEHLLAACAATAAFLLSHCPYLHIVATSRQPLGMTGESLFPVPPLTLPDSEAGQPPEEAEAVRLFTARARDARPEFTLTEMNAPAVVDICRRLDAIPLALELAAARMRMFTVEEIDAHLDDALSLLRGGDRSKPERYQTLRGALDWSYNLLTAAEQQMLHHVCVFSGGWTLEAVAAIFRIDCRSASDSCLGSQQQERDPIRAADALAGLIEKSLVLADPDPTGRMRYRLLETIRQYGLQRLEVLGEAEAVRTRHTEFFVAQAERANRGLQAEGVQSKWRDLLVREQDNLRAALAWSCGHSPILALRIANALSLFWLLEARFAEGRGWLERAITSSAKDNGDANAEAAKAKLIERIVAYGNAAYLAFWADDPRGAVTLGETGLALAQATTAGADEKRRATRAFAALVMGLLETDQTERAAAIAAEGVALGRQSEDMAALHLALVGAGITAVSQGRTDEAASLFRECIDSVADRGNRDDPALTWALYYMAGLALLSEEPSRAVSFAERSLRHAEGMRFNLGIAHATEMLGRSRVTATGDTVSTLGLLRYALSLLQDCGQTACCSHTMECFARVALIRGDAEAATRFLHGAIRVLTKGNTLLMPVERCLFEQSCHAVRQVLPTGRWEAIQQEIATMTVEEVLSLALAVR